MVNDQLKLCGAFFSAKFQSGQLSKLVLTGLLLSALAPTSWAQQPKQHAVASAHPIATAAGHKILAQGGNAFDAAIAVSATLAVVEPYGSGIGGGGFWLLHRAKDQFEVMIDGREKAPAAAHRDMYLDEQGNVQKKLSLNGPLAAGIPGEPAALAHIAQHYGKLPLSQSLAPAIRAARKGFEVSPRYRKLAGFRLKAMQADPTTANIFLHQSEIPALGHLIKQPELAHTLERLANHGKAGFYQGPIAKALVKGVRQAGGIWSEQDLKDYQVVERAPIQATINGLRISAAAPPSSGGIALVTMLNILSSYDLSQYSDAQQTHLIVEAMRRAYRDRAQHLGDPDFIDIPVAQLTHPFYADGLRNSLRLDRATASTELPGYHLQQDGRDTTHFSILDAEGNRVAATLSINYPFGAAFTPKGTGVLLNDEMDDFSAKPGIPNAYGLVGAEANAIAPGKRPLSSMTPTFLETDTQVAILGSPGGSRIITMVLLGALEFMQNKPVNDWVSRPRFHHQFLPDSIQFEPNALDKETQQTLTGLGHKFKPMTRQYGNMQAILWDKQNSKVTAASDPRGEGLAEVKSTR